MELELTIGMSFTQTQILPFLVPAQLKNVRGRYLKNEGSPSMDGQKQIERFHASTTNGVVNGPLNGFAF
jgi:hypothetical protein